MVPLGCLKDDITINIFHVRILRLNVGDCLPLSPSFLEHRCHFLLRRHHFRLLDCSLLHRLAEDDVALVLQLEDLQLEGREGEDREVLLLCLPFVKGKNFDLGGNVLNDGNVALSEQVAFPSM